MNILYFALGLVTTASSRLRVYKVAEALRNLGNHVDTKIAYADVKVGDYDLIVVQKRQDMHRRMKAWIVQGIPIVFDIDDPTDKLPPYTLLTVGSRKLQEEYEGSFYIPDCLDISAVYLPKTEHQDKMRKVCWFGLACNLYHAEPVYDACCELGLELVIVTDLYGVHDYPKWKHAVYIEWELDTVDEIITHCDLVSCPYIFSGHWSKDWIQAKGENRLLKSWALGMPAIGASIPSYREHGLRYVAETKQEWVDDLSALQDKKLREKDAESGRLMVVNRLADSVVGEWCEVFNQCIQRMKNA